MSNQFGAIIKAAKGEATADEKKAAKKPRKRAAEKKTVAAPTTKANGRDVNLTIKVSELRRRHWSAEAKRAGVTITEVICEALSDKFGEPST